MYVVCVHKLMYTPHATTVLVETGQLPTHNKYINVPSSEAKGLDPCEASTAVFRSLQPVMPLERLYSFPLKSIPHIRP